MSFTILIKDMRGNWFLQFWSIKMNSRKEDSRMTTKICSYLCQTQIINIESQRSMVRKKTLPLSLMNKASLIIKSTSTCSTHNITDSLGYLFATKVTSFNSEPSMILSSSTNYPSVSTLPFSNINWLAIFSGDLPLH